MNRTQAPVIKDLVLVGGGHSHVAVLKMFGMHPMPGVRVTLISANVATPYSGMLPGFIAGHYRWDEAHIDLRPLCNFAGAQLYIDRVVGLDLANKQVLCTERPSVGFDLLSLNVGSTPQTIDVPGASKCTLLVKPVERFVKQWEEIVKRIEDRRWKTEDSTGHPRSSILDPQSVRIAVVGGGAGGVELALATQYRLQMVLNQLEVRSQKSEVRRIQGKPPDELASDLCPLPPGPQSVRFEFDLVTASDAILPTHSIHAQRKFNRILSERGMRVHLNRKVIKVERGLLHCSSGEPIAFDVAFWVTHAAPPSWIAQSGLQIDARGFIALNDCLQSLSHPFVFGAGDVAAVENHPRAKSGVFAVRQGRPLAENLRRALSGEPLKTFVPQRHFLSLISTGDKYAVASRNWWALEGKWVWRLKDWVDRRWMRQYQQLPDMSKSPELDLATGLAPTETVKELSSVAMRCGGCGAKVGSSMLLRVLQRLPTVQHDDVLIGLASPDDAAAIKVPPGMVSIQTVDFFRSFINDPYVFGAIAANHDLGDIFAMGAEPRSALAIATVPYGVEAKVEEQLYQLMSGALRVLTEHKTALVGGHTAEGPELAFGLCVHGIGDPAKLLRKGGMQPGDRLILTKPIGTGALFAADMRRKAKGKWIEGALASMLQSNREASHCFLRHAATACTDVTGFGLLGHLAEMVNASKVHVDLFLRELPILDGALEVIHAGIFSSLQPQNLRLRRAICNVEEAGTHDRYPILFDPQTAGGLLASVPEANVESCLRELRRDGYAQAAIIGLAKAPVQDVSPITITR